MPCNYQHASFDKNPEHSKASGWIKKLYRKGKDLFASVEWTDKAIEFIKNKEFKFISPEFNRKYKDENGKSYGFTVLGLALTNVNFLRKKQPAIAFMETETGDFISFGDLEKVMNEQKLRRAFDDVIWPFQDIISKSLRNGKVTNIEELIKYINENIKDIPKVLKEKYNELNKENLNENLEVKTMEKELREILNLQEGDNIIDAVKKLTEDNANFEKQIQDKDSEIKGLNEAKKNLESQVTKLSENKGQVIELKEFNVLKDTVKELTEANTKLENKLALSDAKQVIEGYIHNPQTGKGKILPKQKQQWVNLYLNDAEGIKKILDEMPDVVNFTESGSNSSQSNENDDPTVELMEKAEKLAKEENININDAQNRVLTSDADLKERYFEFTRS